MNALELLQQHQQLCDEIHECAREENRSLRTCQRPGHPALLERKRQLLERLNLIVAELHAVPAASARDAATREQLEKTRGRILQILQLDKENEQLLLRFSLSQARPATCSSTASATLLQKIYARSA